MLDNLFTPIHLLIVLPLFALFFIPTLIAGSRRAQHYYWILLANVVAGGTGVGWIVVLIWALYDRPRSPLTTALS